MEDREIIDLFWERSEEAIRAVSDKYGHFCYKIAWNLLTDQQDCEECVNDTWLGAWNGIPPGKPTRLSAYLGKITRGLAIDKLRRKYAGKRMDTHMVQISGEVERLNRAVVHSIEEHLEREELLESINNFLSGLSDRDRDIFIQRYWMAVPLRDIARRHGITQDSVKQVLFRSRKKLYCILDKEGQL